MKLKQLNEFNFMKRKNNHKINWENKNGIIYFHLNDIDKLYITKYKKGDGYKDRIGKIRVFIKAKKLTISNDHENLDLALKSLVKTINDLKEKAKKGKTETAPADLPSLSLSMFDSKKLEKELNK